jgi:protein ImuB
MFAVIFLSQFLLQAALRLREELHAKPVAVVDDHGEKGVILEANELAESCGVVSGLPSAQALARCGNLTLLPRAIGQEQVAQAALLEVAGSLSPEVEATADGCCTIDLWMAKISDWPAWGAAITERFAALELHARIGVGSNADLAFLAARRAAPVLVVQTPTAFLSQFAVTEIDPPPHLLALLRDWGVHTLGQLTSLPRGELASRLGPDADRLWKRAMGRTHRLLRLVRPVEEFAETFEFEQEIETVEPLLFMLRRFLDQLARRLTGMHRVAAAMRLTLLLENRTTHERLFTIPSPTVDAEVLFRILHTHLEGLQLEQRPTGVWLQIDPVRPDHQQLRLFESPLRDANRFGETLARLVALVGNGNVGVAEIADTHQPDRVRLVEPKFHELRDAPIADAEENLAIGLPLRRYRPALEAQVQVERHEPVYVVSDTAHGRVTDALGPYRLSGGWWDRERWGTEEWDVEIAGSGLFRLSRQNDRWFIEGCYDAQLH